MSKYVANSLLKSTLIHSSLLTTCLYHGNVLSQPPKDTAGAGFLEEVLVTAQKREESLQDVPISMTAISGANIEKFAIKAFDDVVEVIPGVSSDSPNNERGNRNIGIRGVQTQSGSYFIGENTVGFYINNTPISVNDPRLVDLERVEVLRGPQGTLYGASSLAGLIKIVTRKPMFEGYEGHIQGELSTVEDGDSGTDFQGALNIPVTDSFAVRVSGFYEEIAGYIDGIPVNLFGMPTGESRSRDFNDGTSQGARLAAYWEASDSFRAHLSIMRNEFESNASGPTDNYAPSLSDSELTALYRFPVRNNNDDNLASLELEWDFPNFQLQSTTSVYDQYRETVGFDVTNVFGFIATPQQEVPGSYELTRDELVQELRLLSNWDSPLNFILGGFYSKREQEFDTRFPMLPGTTIFGFPNAPEGDVFRGDSTREIIEKALFAQASYELTENWKVSVGLRAFQFDSESSDRFRGNPLLVDGGDFELFGKADDSGVVPRLSVEYDSSDRWMLYASAAEGFRAGGANLPLPSNDQCIADIQNRLGTNSAPSSYESDGLWSYEVGFKSTSANGKVFISASVFHMDWEDIQVQVSPLCNLSGTVVNGGEATSEGFELEIDTVVAENLRLGLGVSYIDAEFSEDVSFGGSFIFAASGSPIPDIPEWSGNLRVDYSLELSPGIDGFIRGTWTYRGDRTALPNVNVGDDRVKDSYDILKLRIGASTGPWTVAIYGDNLTDSQPSFKGTPLAVDQSDIAGLPVDFTLPPRSYGISVRYGWF